MSHYASRPFCEALLARFSVEVGRQLGEMEQSHQSVQEALAHSISRLMNTANEADLPTCAL